MVTIGRGRAIGAALRARSCGDAWPDGRTRFAHAKPSIASTSAAGSGLAMAGIGSWDSDQTGHPSGAVSDQPTLDGAEWDTGITGRRRQRDPVVEVGPQHRKTLHGLVALCLGVCGQRRFPVVLLLHNAPTTSSSVQRCPQGDPSNGHLCAQVPTLIKPADTLAHLDGTIFFALRGGLPYILWHDCNTRWLCPLLHRPTGIRRPAGQAPGTRGRTGADLYGSRPDRHHARPARPGSSPRGRPCRRTRWSCPSSIGWPARCPTRGRSPTPWWPVG